MWQAGTGRRKRGEGVGPPGGPLSSRDMFWSHAKSHNHPGWEQLQGSGGHSRATWVEELGGWRGRQLDPTGVLAPRQVPSAPWGCLRVGVWTALPYITPFPLEGLGVGWGES